VDRFASNQDQKWSSVHSTSTNIVRYILPAKMLRFVIICDL